MFNVREETILALETAIDGGSLAVLRNGGEILTAEGAGGLSKSEDILPLIESLLEKNGIGKREIGIIAVSDGPGSLTGVRIGLAIARGLGDSLAAKIFQISVLEALTYRINFEGEVLSALYSERGGVFFRKFLIKDGQRSLSLEAVQTKNFSEFVQHLKSLKDEKLTVVLPADFRNLLVECFENKDFLKNMTLLPVKGGLAEIIGDAIIKMRLIMKKTVL